MTRAVALAARGRGYVEPNPMVGCVLARRGRIVGEGYHRKFGGPHAEVHALRAAGKRAQGASAYVTLEPCCHFGKTPPCTDALIAAGVSRVVVAMGDPFPKVRGRGLRLLRAAGIDVETGLCAAQAIRLNGPYLKLQRTGRPWVILKWAQSLDGRIATREGDSKWISGQASRQLAHRLRGRVDAVIVGVSTVVADDPLLTGRWGRRRRVATRIVLDPRLRTPGDARIIRTAGRTPTMIVTDRHVARSSRARAYVRSGVEVVGVQRRGDGLDLTQLLKALGRRGVTNVLVEGGGKTLGAFYDAGLADEAIVFVSRRLIGGESARSALAGRGPALIKQARTPVRTRHARCGGDDVYYLEFNHGYEEAR